MKFTSYRSGSGATTTVNTVVAINSMEATTFNQGTRITSELIMFYKNNENNTYE